MPVAGHDQFDGNIEEFDYGLSGIAQSAVNTFLKALPTIAGAASDATTVIMPADGYLVCVGLECPTIQAGAVVTAAMYYNGAFLSATNPVGGGGVEALNALAPVVTQANGAGPSGAFDQYVYARRRDVFKFKAGDLIAWRISTNAYGAGNCDVRVRMTVGFNKICGQVSPAVL